MCACGVWVYGLVLVKLQHFFCPQRPGGPRCCRIGVGEAVTQTDDAGRESGAEREPATSLNAAILRINASLDLDTVLGEAVESARALTGARYGVIVALDEEGAPPQEPVFSGLTPEQERDQLAWPGNARLFEHLRTLPEPVRTDDFPAYVRDLGIDAPWTISRTFQGMPMRHGGGEFGHFFLAEKADGEAFTDEDEEVLALFASQAASAIANARTHRSERRARADLQALVEISPVGVVVFDAKKRPGGAGEPRDAPHRGEPAPARPSAGGPPERAVLPPRRRARGVPQRDSHRPASQQRRDGARRRDGALGAGRAQRQDAHQRDAHPRRGRRHRLRGGDRPGPRAARRDRAAADRVPRAW